MMYRKRIAILLILLYSGSSYLKGCWDYFEIEKRGYILGVAIDKASIIEGDNGNNGWSQRELEAMDVEEGKPKYAYTLQMPIIARAQSKPSGQGGGTGNVERKWNLTVAGNSFFEAQRELSTRADYPPFFEHIQVIIVSEAVARKGIIEPIDVFLRDPEMRRRMKVYVTPGNARNLLELEPKIDDYSSMYLANLLNNIGKTARMPHKVDLGEMSKILHSGRSFILPRVIMDKEEVKLAGAAVFRDGKMIGWIGELDVNYVKWAAGTIKGGTIVVPMPGHPGDLITLEISKADIKVRPEVDGNKITLHLDTNAKVFIAEQFRDEFYNTFYIKFTKALEKAAEEKVKIGMMDIIKYAQNELGADIFFFSNAVQRYVPETWDKVKDNWDEVFKNVKIDVNVDVKMVQRGLIK